MRKLTAIALVLLMVMTGAIAMAETIVVMPKLVGIPYFNASETGALEAGKELNINVVYTGPTQGDAAQQVT